ncbi:hypothetical protein GBAR_LOCUS17874, partial [Geodia barretti]
LVRTDRWQAQLCKAHLNYLQNGNCAEWDSTVLFHVLLHSSLCLFADKFEGTQCIITAQSNVVFPSVPSINFQNVLRNGYKVIFDLGRDQFQTDIVNVQKNCFHIQHVLNPKHGIYSSQMTVDMYICQKKWFCIEELAKLQNNHFAHCQEARIGAAHLHSLIEHAESIFVDLKVSAKVITAMKAIEKESIAPTSVVDKVQLYREKWMKEHRLCEEISKDATELKVHVDQMKTNVRDTSELRAIRKESQQQTKPKGKTLKKTKEVDQNFASTRD